MTVDSDENLLDAEQTRVLQKSLLSSREEHVERFAYERLLWISDTIKKQIKTTVGVRFVDCIVEKFIVVENTPSIAPWEIAEKVVSRAKKLGYKAEYSLSNSIAKIRLEW